MATDDELRTSVEMELEWEPSVDESELGVSVVDGLLTLTGEAGSYAEKWRAERAAARVLGVRGITNEIEVHPGGDKTDLEIARAVADALKWNVMVPSDRVTAEVDRGWVFLEGEVVWNFQRIATERAVRNMAGVKGVSNLITLKPIVEPQDVKMRIEDSFKRALLRRRRCDRRRRRRRSDAPGTNAVMVRQPGGGGGGLGCTRCNRSP